MKYVQINGVGALQKALRSKATMKDVRNVVKVNTSEMNREAARLVPVDTGYLKRSLTLTLMNSGLTGSVKPYADYAPYLEYGTRFMSAQPYMRPAFNKQKIKFISDLNRLMK